MLSSFLCYRDRISQIITILLSSSLHYPDCISLRSSLYCSAHLSVVFLRHFSHCSVQHCLTQIIKDLQSEEKNLQKVIAISDEMIKRQKRELDTLISERDILGSQLVRRNDELSLLYQKVKLLQILISNGNRAYDTRIEVSPAASRLRLLSPPCCCSPVLLLFSLGFCSSSFLPRKYDKSQNTHSLPHHYCNVG